MSTRATETSFLLSRGHAGVSRLGREINITLAVGGMSAVAPSVHMVLAGVTHDRVPISSVNLLADDKTSLCFPCSPVAVTPKAKAVKAEAWRRKFARRMESS